MIHYIFRTQTLNEKKKEKGREKEEEKMEGRERKEAGKHDNYSESSVNNSLVTVYKLTYAWNFSITLE